MTDLCTLVMLLWRKTVIFLTSRRQSWVLWGRICFYSWKYRTALERQPYCGSSQLHFAVYNACYAPLLCKRGMMKRISSLRNRIPAAPPPPCGHKCCRRCSAAHWRKIPSTPILLSWLTWPFYISCAPFMQKGAGQEDAEGVRRCVCVWGVFRAVKPLFRPIHFSSKLEILWMCKRAETTVSMHMSWPCRFGAYLNILPLFLLLFANANFANSYISAVGAYERSVLALLALVLPWVTTL